MASIMTLEEARKNLNKLQAKLRTKGTDAIQVVDNEKPVFFIVSSTRYNEMMGLLDGMIESCEIMQDKEMMRSLKTSEKQRKAGKLVSWSEARKKHNL